MFFLFSVWKKVLSFITPHCSLLFWHSEENTKSRYKDSAVAVPFKFSGQIPSDFVKVNISPIEQERKWT